ncbi:lyase family protein [Microbacterium sp.]|uniref:lyase family protein n=1 Tax=Microbacterium sp. TaxID=51671 RepID=UPI0039E548DD
MPTDHAAGVPFADTGLLSPVTAGHDGALGDAQVLRALVTAEVALTRAWAEVGAVPHETTDAVSAALGWRGPGELCEVPDAALPLAELVAAAPAGGNPVIPLVGLLRAGVPAHAAPWVHRGATSQDVLDSALMLVARRACTGIVRSLTDAETALARFADAHRDEVAAARTLTQHAVPTTIGLRAAGWLRGIRRARQRLEAAAAQLPAQLGGAAGTLASFVELAGAEAAAALPAAFAGQLGLATPDAPWHTARWPVTELGDALVQAVDALGKLAADVATGSRTEIGELAEGAGGGSSAMPHKSNPVRSVLIRSAAIRAPHLAATLHTASALAVDERPDGAWHAEWPALRELLRVTAGAAAHGAALAEGLGVDAAAVRRNLALAGGLVLAERLSIALGPFIGPAGVAEIVAAVRRGEDLGTVLRGLPERADVPGLDDLLDPAGYTGLAAEIVALAVRSPSAADPGAGCAAEPARPDPFER